jgi:O-methyltransferase
MSLIDSVFGNLGYERKGLQVVDRLEGLSASDRAKYARVADRTMVWAVNVIQSVNAVAYIVRAGIPGALVECGVWRGGVMMAMLLEAQACGDTTRHAYMYDTFEGMTAPGPQDMSWDGKDPNEKYVASNPTATGSNWCRASLEDVQEGIASLGLPSSRLHYVKGKVEDTLPGTLPEQISLLRLDTDWYASTKAEMEHLFPRLSPGGVLIVDDYGQWAGSRQAVDEYLAHHQPTMFLVQNGPVAYGIKR